MTKVLTLSSQDHLKKQNYPSINELIHQSFDKIAPFWPLKNLIAVNPLQGLEQYPIEEALRIAYASFQQPDLPKEMEAVNRETIKWIQAYLDEGQATLGMPLRHQGLYTCWRQLSVHDVKLHGGDSKRKQALIQLPLTAQEAIDHCLSQLDIGTEQRELFLTLMLTTLPGWASYIKYRTRWARPTDRHVHKISQEDYLAIRLVITTLLWSDGKELLAWYQKALDSPQTDVLDAITNRENNYRSKLLREISNQTIAPSSEAKAQFVFCIDVRSEPFRKHIESVGPYQTFGFAGFFGIPLHVHDSVTHETYASCPVLLSPKYSVDLHPCSSQQESQDKKGYQRLRLLKQMYQETKYNFVTPFALAEILGIFSGVAMAVRSLFPKFSGKITRLSQKIMGPHPKAKVSLEHIPLSDQCSYALNALTLMGLTENFAPKIVLCGHGSTTQNNAYASALNCGACGGRHGGANALALASILNHPEVRKFLTDHSIIIPDTTHFLGAEHNTTTDEVTLYGDKNDSQIQHIKQDLIQARYANNLMRYGKMEPDASLIKSQKMGADAEVSKVVSDVWTRSQDWAQIRPEWGLAGNSTFIIAPRDLTSGLQLEGRCFLHSYDYQKDPDGVSLTAILTAPMIVTQWINAQYLFSTLDNVAYGGGSKITKNVTGKIGVMQGNASDLMTGLPLQSVYQSDTQVYHSAQRLMTVIFSPREKIDPLIVAHATLQKLFGNGWVQVACIEPESRHIYLLQRDFTWQPLS